MKLNSLLSPNYLKKPVVIRILHCRVLVVFLSVILISACRDLSNPTLPSGTQSPEAYHSREGGLMLSESALRQFRNTWMHMVIYTGLLTDEFMARSFSGPPSSIYGPLDQRAMVEHATTENVSRDERYIMLHELRGQARIARSVIAEYAPDLPGVIARLYAFEAYAAIWLADTYYSGIPLSTLTFKGDYTYTPPLTTEKVYANAIDLFDSALTFAEDSIGVANLARLGKARALLATGNYPEAEATITGMSHNDFYNIRIGFRETSAPNAINLLIGYATVSDLEGGNGFPYISSSDPRTAVVLAPRYPTDNREQGYFPAKFPTPNDSMWVYIVSGIESELIRAEAALQRKDWSSFISILSTLRTDNTYKTDTIYTDSSNSDILRVDTLWNSGAGNVAGLPPLTDPGTEKDRIKMLFDERAAWLFSMGYRQGDLRRLVRNYGWDKEMVYPTGIYDPPSAIGSNMYGSDISIPIPPTERRNPHFHGCLSRD